jgi:NTE family protein
MICFAVDLFDSRGPRPSSLETGLERTQDIAFSTQALRAIASHGREHQLRHMIAAVAAQVPANLGARGRAAKLAEAARHNALEVVLVAYRPRPEELARKTFEFSRASVLERWEAGRANMERAIDKLEAPDPTTRGEGFTFYDSREGRS